MEKLFLTLLNMSMTASYVILVVMAVRLLLKKAPKVISYALWSVVALRLILPFSFKSIFSLLPKTTTPIPKNIVYEEIPKVSTGFVNVDQFINTRLPMGTPQASVNPLQIYIIIGSYIWLLGMIAMLAYGIVSIIILKKKLKEASRIEGNVYEASNLKIPFVLGIIHPKIYLPSNLNQDEHCYVLAHEETHIKRYDHIIKPWGFILLSIHWFNPLVWVAFRLMSVDMELSCDEKVLRQMDEKMKKPYAHSLLSLATGKTILNGSPLAFGEGSVRNRIKNVLSYKKSPFWVIMVAGIIGIIVSIGLLANPRIEEPKIDEQRQDTKPVQVMKEDTPEPTAPLWALDQIIGADMAELDYVSDDMIIFHGSFGLYVYDLNMQEIIRALDLGAIGCSSTQGDDYCWVEVSMDGNTVQLHLVSSDEMYVYTVSGHTLKKVAHEPMENPYWKNFISVEEAWDELHSLENGMGSFSYNVAQFDKNKYGYLHTTDWTLGTLAYKRGEEVFYLFKGSDTVISLAKSASPASIVIRYTNPTDKEVLYGQSHILERLNGMEWVTIPLKPNVGWEDIGKVISPNQYVEEGINLIRMHGILDAGYYQIIKPMRIGDSYIDVITEFQISGHVIKIETN